MCAAPFPTGSSPSTPLPVVLVHGAWHGGWCWAALQAELDRRAIPSYAIDLPGQGASTAPLGDLHGDAAHVAEVIDRLGTDVVLVGHSYGGAVITEAAVRTGRVRHLVYLTAFALDAGESVLGLLRTLPHHDVALSAAMRPGTSEGTTVLDPASAVPALYARCDAAAVQAALARLSPQSMATFTQETTGCPRPRVASTYVVCTEDEAVHPVHQEAMAERCDTVVRLDTDHSPFLSAVTATADVIEAAVAQAGARP